MAYEISEGAAAGALFLSDTTLNSMKVGQDDEYVKSVMAQIHTNLKSGKVVMGNSAARYLAWFDPNKAYKTEFKMNKEAKLTAVVHGCSAALGIRKFMMTEGDRWTNTNVKVYLTGAAWHQDIAFLQITVGGWKDYNSSDLVVVKGICYYGISLKKKEKETSANPTMINKSFVKLLESSKMEEFAKEFWNARELYFGGLVESQGKNGGALNGSNFNGMSPKDLFNSKVWNPIAGKWVYLIDLKGEGKLELKKGIFNYDTRKIDEETCIMDNKKKPIVVDENFKNNFFVRELFGYDGNTGNLKTRTIWTMRSKINKELGNIEGPGNIYRTIQEIAKKEKLAEIIGEYLVGAVLKTELQGANSKLKGKMEGGKHFGFALITALGAVKTNTKGETKITASGSIANVKTNPTMQQAVSNLKNGNWKIRIADNESKDDIDETKDEEESTPAKIFFNIGVIPKGSTTGKYKDLLKLEIRYKGSFQSSPQFLGGMSETLEEILKNKSKKIENEFTRACDK